MARLRPDEAPIITTDGVLTTVAAGVEFFGGGIRIGIARAVDRRDAWSSFPWR
jgi:hypothetical protein